MSHGIPLITFVAGIILGAVLLIFYASVMRGADKDSLNPSNYHDTYKALMGTLERERQTKSQTKH